MRLVKPQNGPSCPEREDWETVRIQVAEVLRRKTSLDIRDAVRFGFSYYVANRIEPVIFQIEDSIFSLNEKS